MMVTTCASNGTRVDNCPYEDVDAIMKSLELVIYVPVFIFGLVLNIIAIVVFCIVFKKWTESTVYMTNLALMDLLLLLQLPFKMHARDNKWLPNKQTFCSFLESLYFMGMYGSIYTIVCISIDRYIAICHPYRSKWLRSKKIARTVCSAIWVFVVLATVPVYTFHEQKDCSFNCFHGFSDKGWNTALIICLELFGFLIPAFVLVTCSTLSIRALKESNVSAPEKQGGIRIIYSSICAFLVPFTPSHVAIFLHYLAKKDIITACRDKRGIVFFVQLTICLSNISSCLDAICYYFIAKEVRASKRVIRQSISRMRNSSTSEL